MALKMYPWRTGLVKFKLQFHKKNHCLFGIYLKQCINRVSFEKHIPIIINWRWIPVKIFDIKTNSTLSLNYFADMLFNKHIELCITLSALYQI